MHVLSLLLILMVNTVQHCCVFIVIPVPDFSVYVFKLHVARQTRLENCPKTFPDLPPPSELSPDSFSTTPAEVFDTLSGLKPGKAPALVGLPPKLLSLCARGISVSLCALFNRSFSEGCIPSAWKEALVVPVHKGGPRSCPPNYRLIALLSIVSKTMEKIGLKQLSAFLGPLLTPKQSGFWRGDGTFPQLIRLVQEWSVALDSAHLVGVVFFDFKKAFDRVCLPGLLLKLKSAGLQGKAHGMRAFSLVAVNGYESVLRYPQQSIWTLVCRRVQS